MTPKDMALEARKRLFRCLGQRVPGADGKHVSRFERDLKGLPLTVEYGERSAKTGKPLRAKARAFRTYEGGPGADPVRALLAECGEGAGAGAQNGAGRGSVPQAVGAPSGPSPA